MKTTINRSNELKSLRNELSKLNSIDRVEYNEIDNEIRIYKNFECIMTIDDSMEVEERVEGFSEIVDEVINVIR